MFGEVAFSYIVTSELAGVEAKNTIVRRCFESRDHGVVVVVQIIFLKDVMFIRNRRFNRFLDRHAVSLQVFDFYSVITISEFPLRRGPRCSAVLEHIDVSSERGFKIPHIDVVLAFLLRRKKCPGGENNRYSHRLSPFVSFFTFNPSQSVNESWHPHYSEGLVGPLFNY